MHGGARSGVSLVLRKATLQQAWAGLHPKGFKAAKASNHAWWEMKEQHADAMEDLKRNGERNSERPAVKVHVGMCAAAVLWAC